MAFPGTGSEKTYLKRLLQTYSIYERNPSKRQEYSKPWNFFDDKAGGEKLWNEYQNWQLYGQRVGGKPKPPATWLSKRRDYMTRRYSSTPSGGFSGALGGASVQKKQLLGR